PSPMVESTFAGLRRFLQSDINPLTQEKASDCSSQHVELRRGVLKSYRLIYSSRVRQERGPATRQVYSCEHGYTASVGLTASLPVGRSAGLLPGVPTSSQGECLF